MIYNRMIEDQIEEDVTWILEKILEVATEVLFGKEYF